MKKNGFSGVILLTCLLLSGLSMQAGNVVYKLTQRIAVPGSGWWDYLAVDTQHSRLFVSHADQVNVVDLKTNKAIAIIPNTPGVHGITFAYDLNKGFISDGQDSSVTVFDLSTLKTIGKIQVTGKNPDAILYDPFSHCVLTFNGRSSNATVINGRTGAIVTTITLPGNPEFAQTDAHGHVFVNIESKSTLVRINATKWSIEKEWSIAPGEEPSGLAIDVAHERLFSVCRNKKMIVSDAVAGKVIATLPIGSRCDGVAYDPLYKRIISSNGEGTITVVQEETPNLFRVLNNFPTQTGARTIAVNPKTGRLYLSVAELEPGQGRRPVKPGTFHVLVVAP
ncbi:YncE family protein [Microbacter margulisiae]|uniref:DNA-binding beta-propeller fold protein YncE n=1 Tax=Microbacter margulisiae TaxID=1350067 RepID=A0A7W5DNS1_9PORP|nr:YncE family protein [Microbacter margulisiae]MBB3186151.1 DNA-binding beta-propeller fold protein YncE [Microbacter margulisiae]